MVDGGRAVALSVSYRSPVTTRCFYRLMTSRYLHYHNRETPDTGGDHVILFSIACLLT